MPAPRRAPIQRFAMVAVAIVTAVSAAGLDVAIGAVGLAIVAVLAIPAGIPAVPIILPSALVTISAASGSVGAQWVSWVFTPLVGAAVLLLVLVQLGPDRVRRWWSLTIVPPAAAAVVVTVTYDPFLDVDCGQYCGHNPIAVLGSSELSGVAALLVLAYTCGAAVLLGVAAAADWGTGSGRSRIQAVVLSASSWCWAVSYRPAVSGSPGRHLFEPSRSALGWWSAGAALAALAVGMSAVSVLVRRARLYRMAVLLEGGRQMADVQATLRRVLADPRLEIRYQEADDQPPLDATGRTAVLLSIGRTPIATVLHSGDSARLLASAFPPQAQLAMHNEHLLHVLSQQRDEVAQSRRRLVDLADLERRRLERDLHDGAQQHLIAVAFGLRRAERLATDERVRAELAMARRSAENALRQVRIVAAGIHPAILVGAGLTEAVLTLADSTGASVRIRDTGHRPDQAVESVLYAIIAALLATTLPGVHTTVLLDQARLDRGVVGTVSAVRLRVSGVQVTQWVLDRVEAADGRCSMVADGVGVILPCEW